jgi:F0F1-type ATP synthase, subunit a
MELKEILEHHIIDHVWTYLGFGPINLPISKHLLMMAIAALLMLFGLPLIIRSRSAALAPFRSMIEVIVLFLRDDVIRPSMGPKGDAFIGYFSTLFFFILSMNLIGLVPYGATATGNLGVTAALAFMTFVLIIAMGIKEQGPVGYITHMVPKGVPLWLYPILFPIELIGLVTKAFALCIRLFANMLGGHIVILSFISFIFIFGSFGAVIGFGVAPISIILVLFMMMLEIFVAFLQAYIFVFLTAIFTGMAMHPH